MNVLIIGLGISGRSAASFLLKKGYDVCGTDGNRELLNSSTEIVELKKRGLKTVHESELDNVRLFDMVVVSPGIPPMHPLYQKAKAAQIEIVGEVELAFRFLKGTVLAITGTNGKTTVTLLVEHVLNHNGKTAKALGNVGTPLTAECESNSSIISVVELSSYQLETLQGPLIDAAVLLNITPDHLDRYSDMEAYAKAKWRLAACLKADSEFFVEENCYKKFGHLTDKPVKTYGYSRNCNLRTDLKNIIFNTHVECVLPKDLQGKMSHDVENILAAYALCKHVGITSDQFLNALKTFKKPKHRIQFVKEINGISFYDDSKGTNLDAVIRAVESMEGSIILIAGGIDKGAPYSPWINAFKNKVRHIFAIGQAAKKIKQDMVPAIPVDICCSLEEAVMQASSIAKHGDVVLLSPGCSSFDMFKDYAHRGDEFQRIVNSLETQVKSEQK